MEISVKAIEESRVAAESAANTLLKVTIECPEGFAKCAYFRISKIVGGSLYSDRTQQQPIGDYHAIASNGMDLILWFVPHLYEGKVPSFFVEQISETGEIGGSVTMTLNLLDPQLRGHVAGV